jgi:amidase
MTAVTPWSSATDMAAALSAGSVSAAELLELHLERVERWNPILNAVVTLDVEGARAAALAADVRRSRGMPSSPLDGLPLTIKDSIATAGLRTTSGAELLREFVPAEDALVVKRLRECGAVIFGKTNLPPFAGDFQTDNALFGRSRNPWNLAHTPGGSSGGSAAALAAGLTPLELGSDIGGSVRQPAHCCGLYAHKPTFEAIPARGHIPPPPGIASLADMGTLGPMARTAGDLGFLFDALSARSPAQAGWVPNLVAPRASDLAGMRVALWSHDSRLPVDEETRALIESAGVSLERAGARVDRAARPFENLAAVIDAYFTLLVPLMAAALTPAEIDSLAQWAREGDRLAVHALRAVRSPRMTAAEYAKAREAQAQACRAWEAFFSRFDLLLCPIAPTPALAHDTAGTSFERRFRVDGVEYPWWDQALWCGALANFAYLPATARPLGRSKTGLPIGVQLVGPFMEDRTCLAAARLLDELWGGFEPPSLVAGS